MNRPASGRRHGGAGPWPRRLSLVPLALLLLPMLPARAELWTDFERGLGQLALTDMTLRHGRVEDPLLRDWVDRLAAPLAAQSTRGFTFRFVILGSYENNAFSLPGGIICVTRGLLSHVTSDEELAGVLAHEVAHAEDHDFQRLLQRELAFFVAQGVLREHVGRDWIYATQIVQLLDALRSQRGHETQADLKGAELAFAAHYDPQGVATFLEQIPDGYGFGGALFATHPRSARRLQDVRRALTGLVAGRYDDLLAAGDSLRDRGHLRRAEEVYAQAAQMQPDRPEAPRRAADVRQRRGLPETGPALQLAPTNAEASHLAAALTELRAREQDQLKAEARLRRSLQAYQRDRDIARALEVSQAIVPEISDAQYLATLARAIYALSASWTEAMRLGEMLSRSGALRAGWERTATDLQATHKVTGGGAANEAEFAAAMGQFDGAVPAVSAATDEVGRAAHVAGELSQATRMLALAFLALVASGPDQPLGRLNFTRFLLLQGDIVAAEGRLRRVAKAGRQAHAEIVRRHLEVLGEQVTLLHACGRPALRALDDELLVRRMGRDILDRPTGAFRWPVQDVPAPATVEHLQALDTVLRMCYLDMRAERGQ